MCLQQGKVKNKSGGTARGILFLCCFGFFFLWERGFQLSFYIYNYNGVPNSSVSAEGLLSSSFSKTPLPLRSASSNCGSDIIFFFFLLFFSCFVYNDNMGLCFIISFSLSPLVVYAIEFFLFFFPLFFDCQ